MRRVAHLRSIPLLAAPAASLVVNDAGASAAAAFVVLHGLYFLGQFLANPNFRCFCLGRSSLWDLGDARAFPPVGKTAAIPVNRHKQVRRGTRPDDLLRVALVQHVLQLFEFRVHMGVWVPMH